MTDKARVNCFLGAIFAAVLAVFVLTKACGMGQPAYQPAPPAPVPVPTPTDDCVRQAEGKVKFQVDILPLMQGKCASSGCHPEYTGHAAAKKDAKKILAQVEAGKMPKGGSRLPSSDIAKLKTWIADGLRDADECLAAEPVKKNFTWADGIALAAQDIVRVPQEQRNLTGYVGLFGHFGETEAAQQALAKLINSVSTEKILLTPVPLDNENMLFRFYWQDFGVNAAERNLILANAGEENPLDETPDGLLLRQLTGTNFPLVKFDWLQKRLAEPPLYYQIVGVPATLAQLQANLGVAENNSFARHEGFCVGYNGSLVGQNNRILCRHDSQDGYFWKTFDFLAVVAGQDDRNIFQFPLVDTFRQFQGQTQFDAAASEVIWTLPNGLQGYAIFNAQGQRIDAADPAVVVDFNRPDRTIRPLVSCTGCHINGIIDAVDQVRNHVLDPRNRQAFVQADLDAVAEVYKAQATVDRYLKADQGAYARAHSVLGFAPTNDPIGIVANRYDGNLGFAQMAGEVGLTEADFNLCVTANATLAGLLGPVIAGGVVSRETFLRAYPQIVVSCRLGKEPI